jgi:hypothetical protein
MTKRVPLESWQSGPDNRWAYQHVGDVVPTVVVPRGDGPEWTLPERPLDLDGLAFGGTTLEAYLDDGYVDGLAVIHDGDLVYERYRNGMGPDSRHLSQSVGKSVLGLLIGILAGRGVLDPESPVGEHVPELAGSGYAGATVRHLLDMTAAIDFAEEYGGEFWKYDAACGWHPRGPGADAASILEYLPTIGAADWRHGERVHYASPNTDLLGVVAERAGGAPLADLVARELWAPMGAADDAELAVDPAGTAVISGGFCATLRDYSRVGRLVLDDGRDVVPAAWTAGLGRGDAGAFARCTSERHATTASGYRDQWWSRGQLVVARGIHGQQIAVDRRAGVVVTILASWPDATDAAHQMAQTALIAAVCDAVATPIAG